MQTRELPAAKPWAQNTTQATRLSKAMDLRAYKGPGKRQGPVLGVTGRGQACLRLRASIHGCVV